MYKCKYINRWYTQYVVLVKVQHPNQQKGLLIPQPHIHTQHTRKLQGVGCKDALIPKNSYRVVNSKHYSLHTADHTVHKGVGTRRAEFWADATIFIFDLLICPLDVHLSSLVCYCFLLPPRSPTHFYLWMNDRTIHHRPWPTNQPINHPLTVHPARLIYLCCPRTFTQNAPMPRV